MRVTVAVRASFGISLPASARLYVEIRDVSLQDGPSITLCAHQSSVISIDEGGLLETLNFLVPPGENRRTLNVWGHVSLSGEEKIEQGDFLTTQAYPVRNEVAHDYITIELQKI